MGVCNTFPICEKGSKYDIGYDYTSYCYGNKVNNEEKERILNFFDMLLDTWCLDDLYKELNNIINNFGDEAISSSSFIINHFKKLRPPKNNLLRRQDYRTHKELLIKSPPPIAYYDDILMEFKNTIQDQYIEPLASYSMKQLINYINSFDKYILKELNNTKRLIGGAEYMLDVLKDTTGALSIFLFAFDNCIAHHKGNHTKMKNIFDLENYLEKAINIHNKIVDRQIYGDFKFVQKRRLLFDRSGILEKQRKKEI